MKFLVICIVVLISQTVMAEVPPPQLISALILKESGGDDMAIGDKHLTDHAYGCLQIRKPCITDYNRWHKTSYAAEDMLGNRELSIKVFKSYIDHYATTRLLGHTPTLEDMARIWNGGPSGWKKASTVAYGQDVLAIIQSLAERSQSHGK